MNSISESGHANNVAHFIELCGFAASYGTAYKPAKASIKIAALQNVSTNAAAAIAAVNAALTPYRTAVDARETAFHGLTETARRIMNFLMASDTTEIINDSVNSLVRKIVGTRAKAKLTEEEKNVLAAQGKAVKEISASQMGYDNRMDNFDKLIKMLAGIPLYIPNEADLKIAALTNYYMDLKQKNADVITAWIPLSNARLTRNEVLYKEITGLHDLAIDVKHYVKSAFGISSTQYKQISKLKFTTLKK